MRFRLPQRINLVGTILWGLRIVVAVLVLAGSYATLSSGQLSPDAWRELIVFGIAQVCASQTPDMPFQVPFSLGPQAVFGGQSGRPEVSRRWRA